MTFSQFDAKVFLGNSLELISKWPSPTAIVVDGPYGVSGYPGDPATTKDLAAWYEPHVQQWSSLSGGDTTLWFWGTELSWAVVHPLLVENDWEYRGLHIWNKGLGQIAGNVNSSTIRRFPVVTEVCGQYTKVVRLQDIEGNKLVLQDWLRSEWKRTGMPLYKTNEAAGVKNAATRKYFTSDHLWYFPPPQTMQAIADYANEHGQPTDVPYFSTDRVHRLTAENWARLRSKWNHKHGITNVWDVPSVRGSERLKGPEGFTHTNQKPLSLMKLIIEASTDIGDVVWEPFGGLCSASLAAKMTGRRGYAAEINPAFYAIAKARLSSAE